MPPIEHKCHSLASITMTRQSHPAGLMESIFLVSEAVASPGPVNVRAAWIASSPAPAGANWPATPPGIDLSVITQAVWASEKLHLEVLSLRTGSNFFARCKRGRGGQRRRGVGGWWGRYGGGRDMVSMSFTTALKLKRRLIPMVCHQLQDLDPVETHVCELINSKSF